MPAPLHGVNPYLEAGPDSLEVTVDVNGGQVVMIDPDTPNLDKVKPTTGPVATALGVARIPASPQGDMGTNLARLRRATSVMYGPIDVPVTYLNDASPGDLLVTASEGRVQKYDPDSGHTPDLIFARCTQPGGVAAGSTGRVRIGL